MTLNKSATTTLLAVAVTAAGYLQPLQAELLRMVGWFALSGSITNWLAVHMLFERVPLLYGSGVIPNRFEEFKAAIKSLILREFFTREHIERFFMGDDEDSAMNSLSKQVNLDTVFDRLVEAIMESSFGSMLGMIGGKDALEKLRDPVKEKLSGILKELASAKPQEGEEGSGLANTLYAKVEAIIDSRLQELTPAMVKRIVQDMIRAHLGWLVVWGGVFGGIIGGMVYWLPAG